MKFNTIRLCFPGYIHGLRWILCVAMVFSIGSTMSARAENNIQPQYAANVKQMRNDANAGAPGKDFNPLSKLVLMPGDNQAKGCATEALSLNQTIIMGILDGADKKTIEKFLRAYLSKDKPDMKAVDRARILKEWRQSSKPGNIAALDFEICQDNKAPIGDLGKLCFNLEYYPALIQLLKERGKLDKEIFTEVRKLLPDNFSDAFVKHLMDIAGKDNYRKSHYLAQRVLFASCIQKYLPRYLHKSQ